MGKKEERVVIKGSVSKETAEKMLNGELVSKNGLRQAHGRASLNPEQPDFWIDNEQPIARVLKDNVREIAPKLLVHGMKKLWYEAVEPRLIEAVKNVALPRLFEMLGNSSDKGIADKEVLSNADNQKLEISQTEANVINLADYRCAHQKVSSGT